MVGRKGGYLFRRGNIWWIRFQYNGVHAEYVFGPGKKSGKKEFSLRTQDRAEAEFKSLGMIATHKHDLYFTQNIDALREHWAKIDYNIQKYPEGKGVDQHGREFFATDDHLHYTSLSGKIIRKEPNRPRTENPEHYDDGLNRALGLTKSSKVRKDPDTKFLDLWAADQRSQHIIDDATRTFEMFKRLVNNRPLKLCTRDDGRLLVTRLKEVEHNKNKTIGKKLALLAAIVRIAILDGKLEMNPFVGIAPKADDSTKRLPLSMKDMALVAERFSELRPPDQLLWKMLALTGMRLDEAFQIDDEEEPEGGVRFVIIGKKTLTAKRRVPFPEMLLPSLPAKIEGGLFEGDSETAGKRILYFLRRLGISYDRVRKTGDRRKVTYSLRHRAKDRLRSCACKMEIQYELLGHEKKTVAESYGLGSPVPLLYEWINKIGM